MHPAALLSSTGEFCHLIAASISTASQPVLADIADTSFAGNSSISWDDLKGDMEIVFGSFSFLVALGLFGYFTYLHRQIRLSTPKGLRKKSLWTTDQINACLITFGIALMFLLLHYS